MPEHEPRGYLWWNLKTEVVRDVFRHPVWRVDQHQEDLFTDVCRRQSLVQQIQNLMTDAYRPFIAAQLITGIMGQTNA